MTFDSVLRDTVGQGGNSLAQGFRDSAEVEVRAEPQVFTRVFARSRDPTWTQSSRIHGVGHAGYSTPGCVEGVEHVVPQGRKRSGTAPREER